MIKEQTLDINGMPMNPYLCELPLGVASERASTIDGLNPMVRGRSAHLLGVKPPHNRMAP